MPIFLGGLGELKYQGERSLVGEASPWSAPFGGGPSRERALDDVRNRYGAFIRLGQLVLAYGVTIRESGALGARQWAADPIR
jgi:hypothetical protein